MHLEESRGAFGGQMPCILPVPVQVELGDLRRRQVGDPDAVAADPANDDIERKTEARPLGDGRELWVILAGSFVRLLEHLDSPIIAVRDKEQAVGTDREPMNNVELPRPLSALAKLRKIFAVCNPRKV